MIQSMTAFASQAGRLETYHWVWEMRSVNGRGLDLRMRVPDTIDGLEPIVRAAVSAECSRGNITVNLRLTADEAQSALTIDPLQLDRVLAALDQVQDRALSMGVTLAQPTAADVLAQRGVLQAAPPNEENAEALSAAIVSDLYDLINAFGGMRQAEGRALLAIITAQLDDIETLIADATAAAVTRRDEVKTAMRAALRRVVDEVSEVDTQRVAQELAMIAVKSDVTEELDRLRAHCAAARALLIDPKPSGRKFDFLAQEFNREANTLCSKAGSPALTAIGLDLKSVIDQMREQIQNVE